MGASASVLEQEANASALDAKDRAEISRLDTSAVNQSQQLAEPKTPVRAPSISNLNSSTSTTNNNLSINTSKIATSNNRAESPQKFNTPSSPIQSPRSAKKGLFSRRKSPPPMPPPIVETPPPPPPPRDPMILNEEDEDYFSITTTESLFVRVMGSWNGRTQVPFDLNTLKRGKAKSTTTTSVDVGDVLSFFRNPHIFVTLPEEVVQAQAQIDPNSLPKITCKLILEYSLTSAMKQEGQFSPAIFVFRFSKEKNDFIRKYAHDPYAFDANQVRKVLQVKESELVATTTTKKGNAFSKAIFNAQNSVTEFSYADYTDSDLVRILFEVNNLDEPLTIVFANPSTIETNFQFKFFSSTPICKLLLPKSLRELPDTRLLNEFQQSYIERKWEPLQNAGNFMNRKLNWFNNLKIPFQVARPTYLMFEMEVLEHIREEGFYFGMVIIPEYFAKHDLNIEKFKHVPFSKIPEVSIYLQDNDIVCISNMQRTKLVANCCVFLVNPKLKYFIVPFTNAHELGITEELTFRITAKTASKFLQIQSKQTIICPTEQIEIVNNISKLNWGERTPDTQSFYVNPHCLFSVHVNSFKGAPLGQQVKQLAVLESFAKQDSSLLIHVRTQTQKPLNFILYIFRAALFVPHEIQTAEIILRLQSTDNQVKKVVVLAPGNYIMVTAPLEMNPDDSITDIQYLIDYCKATTIVNVQKVAASNFENFEEESLEYGKSIANQAKYFASAGSPPPSLVAEMPYYSSNRAISRDFIPDPSEFVESDRFFDNTQYILKLNANTNLLVSVHPGRSNKTKLGLVIAWNVDNSFGYLSSLNSSHVICACQSETHQDSIVEKFNYFTSKTTLPFDSLYLIVFSENAGEELDYTIEVKTNLSNFEFVKLGSIEYEKLVWTEELRGGLTGGHLSTASFNNNPITLVQVTKDCTTVQILPSVLLKSNLQTGIAAADPFLGCYIFKQEANTVTKQVLHEKWWKKTDVDAMEYFFEQAGSYLLVFTTHLPGIEVRIDAVISFNYLIECKKMDLPEEYVAQFIKFERDQRALRKYLDNQNRSLIRNTVKTEVLESQQVLKSTWLFSQPPYVNPNTQKLAYFYEIALVNSKDNAFIKLDLFIVPKKQAGLIEKGIIPNTKPLVQKQCFLAPSEISYLVVLEIENDPDVLFGLQNRLLQTCIIVESTTVIEVREKTETWNRYKNVAEKI